MRNARKAQVAAMAMAAVVMMAGMVEAAPRRAVVDARARQGELVARRAPVAAARRATVSAPRRFYDDFGWLRLPALRINLRNL